MPEPVEPVQFIGPEQFAEATWVSVHTVRTMLRTHRLAATKTSPGKGGSWLIPASEVERLRQEAEMWRVDVERPQPEE